jgi:hypothetical protein
VVVLAQDDDVGLGVACRVDDRSSPAHPQPMKSAARPALDLLACASSPTSSGGGAIG